MKDRKRLEGHVLSGGGGGDVSAHGVPFRTKGSSVSVTL